MRRLAGLAVAVGLLVVALTWVALESGEVAVLRTTRSDGFVRETRVWIARHEGDLWIEAGTPERLWYQDILRHPPVSLVLGGSTRLYEAEVVPGREGHARIRALLREKYGLRDWWIGCLQDNARSIAVRLVPASAASSR